MPKPAKDRTCLGCGFESRKASEQSMIDCRGVLFRNHRVRPDRNAKEMATLNRFRAFSKLSPLTNLDAKVTLCLLCSAALADHIRRGFDWLDAPADRG